MHSHIIISPTKDALETASEISPSPIKESIDCLVFTGEDSLKISQVRDMKKFLQKKPYQEDFQIIYIEDAHRFTIPAQNSLLKTLEEPPAHAQIILTTPYPDRLLPTVISRCRIISPNKSTPTIKKDFKEVGEALESISDKNPGERVNLAQNYAYPKTKAISFLQNAILYFRDSLHQNPKSSHSQNAALAQKSLTRVQSNIDPKLTLEHFFLKML